uniref:Sec-independent protein translocase component TatC n=1 Tax=Deltalsia parasitica TaxID=1424640 RepID=UPI0022FDA537|nr:Sec-independent protein translocase component TatC [Deltalsia parasitica]WAX04291.1 Sec-independent protein translocase component TatC [Deltalsia parasitica]
MNILLKEVSLLFRYFFVTFSLLSFLAFKKFPTILLFFFYPAGKIFKKKLIILHTLELINSSFFLTLFINGFFIFLFFCFLIKMFLSPSWYILQIKVFSDFLFLSFLSLSLSLSLSCLIFFFIFHFSLLWNFETFSLFHLFEIQFQMLRFLEFQIKNLNIFCSSFFLLLITINIIRWFFSWKFLFLFLFQTKVFFIFIFIFIFIIFFSELTFFLFTLFILTFLFLELIFFYICWKLQ